MLGLGRLRLKLKLFNQNTRNGEAAIQQSKASSVRSLSSQSEVSFLPKKANSISSAMEMKNFACAALFAAATLSAAVAADESLSPAAAPGPSSAASAALPALGSLVGASLVSFVAYFLN
ncbi:unnamed protein product [Citrullus colocynthis]|uniref:Uncharacterized protein n=1 Tax=Citrullus colocynthis TaxID=252529 RepID=A0ABP0XQ22_9ROSI